MVWIDIESVKTKPDGGGVFWQSDLLEDQKPRADG